MRHPPSTSRTYTLFPSTTLLRSDEAAVAEVSAAETAGEMAEETRDPAADVPASDSDGASQADGVAAPTVKEIIRRVGDLARELEKAEAVRRASRASAETAMEAPPLGRAANG